MTKVQLSEVGKLLIESVSIACVLTLVLYPI
ncbi:MAG: hypothetical protein H6Q69_405 [Firmicutes bacterium]|nr:hypothetical protein [Bacillota bacterium]